MSLINAVRNAVLTTFGGTPTLSRPHGIDFGRWRQWAEPDNPPKPLDFVIAGVTSGNHVNQMWEANRVTLADYRENGGIVGLYHFYEPVNALSQIKVFMECVEEINPQFVAVDFEELYKGQVLGASDAKILKELILALWEYYPRDKVMIYCGHDTWVVNVRKYDPAFFDQVELWLTWPNDAGENTVAFHPFYASKMGRRFEDVRIFQYSWDGDAPAYGIINGPLDLDLDVYVHAQPFDEWLGIEPEEPEEEITMETSEFYKIVAEHMERQTIALEASSGYLKTIAEATVSGTPAPVAPPTEKPTQEAPDWMNWWEKPESEWPLVVGGLKVAYVTPTADKLAMWDGEDSIWEDENLFPWSTPKNKDSIRILAYRGDPIMVYAEGADYHDAVDPDVRPEQLGGFVGYRVMHQNKLNVKVWEAVDENDKIWVPISQVKILKK